MKSSQQYQSIQSIHILDTSRIIEEPPKICDSIGGFCCNGFHFDIEPNETISYNDTLLIYKGNRIIGNITKLRYGCQLRGSRPNNQSINQSKQSISNNNNNNYYLLLLSVFLYLVLVHCQKKRKLPTTKPNTNI